MKERWLPAGILAGTLFVVNVIARLVVRLVAGKDDDKQIGIGLVTLIVTGLVVVVAAVIWARRNTLSRVWGDVTLAIFVGCLLSTLIGPFISSGKAFGGGFGLFLAELFYYCGVCGLGAVLGVLGVIAAGADHKSQLWERYARTLQTRPRRVTRR